MISPPKGPARTVNRHPLCTPRPKGPLARSHTHLQYEAPTPLIRRGRHLSIASTSPMSRQSCPVREEKRKTSYYPPHQNSVLQKKEVVKSWIVQIVKNCWIVRTPGLYSVNTPLHRCLLLLRFTNNPPKVHSVNSGRTQVLEYERL